MSESEKSNIIYHTFSEKETTPEIFPLTGEEIAKLFQRASYIRGELLAVEIHHGRYQEELKKARNMDIKLIYKELVESRPTRWDLEPAHFSALLQVLENNPTCQKMRAAWVAEIKKKRSDAEEKEKRDSEDEEKAK